MPAQRAGRHAELARELAGEAAGVEEAGLGRDGGDGALPVAQQHRARGFEARDARVRAAGAGVQNGPPRRTLKGVNALPPASPSG